MDTMSDYGSDVLVPMPNYIIDLTIEIFLLFFKHKYIK